MPSKYRSTERRKERCRNAARSRRTKEAEIFTEIEQSLPLSRQQLQQLDKISVMRVFTNTLKLRVLFKHLKDTESHQHDKEFAEALDSFVLLLDQDGTVVYVSNNVTKHLGIPAVDMHGSSIYQYAHPCDHNEIQEALGACTHADTAHSSNHSNREFFIRLKCALSATGRNVSVSTTSLYKVIKCSSRMQTESDSKLNLSVSTENPPLQCMIVIGSVIPQDTEINIDNFTFVSQHSSTMKFTSVDEKVTNLLGYKPSELYNKSVFEFHHAADSAALEKAYAHLFSKGQTETMLYRFLAKGGGYVWMKTQATTICDKHSHRPQSVVCVNYVVSGIEEPGLVMAAHQVPSATDTASSSAVADECLVETLRLFGDKVTIPTGPLDVVHFPVSGHRSRRASSTSTVTTSSVSATDDSYATAYGSDGFNIDDGLATVYEDLCLSDCMLSDYNLIDSGGGGIDTDSDAIERMTDAVFNNPDDESLPDMQTDILDFVDQDNIHGKRRTLSIDSIFDNTPTKRPCTESDNILTTTSAQNSILMNLLTTGEGQNYQLQNKRHSFPRSSKDQHSMKIPHTMSKVLPSTLHTAYPQTVTTQCTGKSTVVPSKNLNTLYNSSGPAMSQNSPVSSLGIVSQRTENMLRQNQAAKTATVTRAPNKQTSYQVATQSLQVPSATSASVVAMQQTPATHRREPPKYPSNGTVGVVTAANSMKMPSKVSPWLPESLTAKDGNTTSGAESQPTPLDHPYFTRKKRKNSTASQGGQSLPDPLAETVRRKLEDDLPAIPVVERRSSQCLPELNMDTTTSPDLGSPLTASPLPGSPVGSSPTAAGIQVIGDSTALQQGSVRIQNFTPETVNTLSSSGSQPTNGMTSEVRPDYYLISAGRLQELLAAANLQKNGFRK